MSDAESLSAEDLRARLYHNLREKGLVDALKSQLRNKLVTELKQVGGEQSFSPQPLYAEEGSLLQRAANALVADHLRRCHYDYCLSIFLPESGSAQDKLFTTRDLLQLLNISPHSKLYKSLASTASGLHKKGFLWQLLCDVASCCGHASQTVSSQTDPMKLSHSSTLDEELRKVEELYATEGTSHKHMAIEERILSYQRALDERSRSDLLLEIARFKEGELARMQLEEREKCRQEIEQAQRDMERSYQCKMDALSERERHSSERLHMQQEIGEKESYRQRQTLLDDIEALKTREHETRRREDTIERENQLWKDKMNSREELVRHREEKVRQAEIEYEQRLHADTTKFRLEEQSRYMDRLKGLEVREARVQEDERRLDTELRTITQVKEELREKRQQVNELEAELTHNRHELISVTKHAEVLGEKMREMVDYQILKEENAVTKRELENTKMRLSELTRDNMVERQKQEELLREMAMKASQPPPELSLRDQQLQKLRNELRQQQAVHEHQRSLLNRQLQSEAGRTQQLLRQHEEQMLQQKEMNREIADLRQQLYGTRQALTNEVYRKPQPLDGDDSMCDAVHGDQYGGPIFTPVGLSTDPTTSPDFHPILETVASVEHTDDLSVSLDLVQETKRRLHSLEKEAQNLENNYQDFQFRMTSVHATLEPQQYTPVRSAPQYTSSHAEGRLNSSRPLSSTPARAIRPNRTTVFNDPTNLSTHDAVPPSLLNTSVSTVHSSPPDEHRLQPRSLKVTDLEARPGSPPIVVMAASDSSHPSSSHGRGPEHQHRQVADFVPPSVSLDSDWKSKQDSASMAREREEKEEREREERRRKVQEERRLREEEAWEQEQRALQALQGNTTTPREPSPELVRESEKDAEKSPGIDPTMQRYMEMVQQQKNKEKQEMVVKKTIDTWNKGKSKSEDKTPSVSEQDISAGADEDEDNSERINTGKGSDDDNFW